jgi:putative phosphoribosyl transferase
MYFIDRYDAAMQLVVQLEKYKNEDGIILAIPKGGVPIGYYIARHLDFPLDLLMSKKLAHPMHKEYAIGAVGLEDTILEEAAGISDEYIKSKVLAIRQRLLEKYKIFMGNKKPLNIKGKTVIITDDGIATGRTILGTIRMLKANAPARLVIAVPVSSIEAAERIRKEVDDFICLHTPYPFFGVGRFYENFSQVTDEEVIHFLDELNAKNATA